MKRPHTRRTVAGHGWVHLPPWSDPGRWLIPRGPRAVATAALRVYQPVTRRAAFAWRLARIVASLGAFRLLPARAAPDSVLAIEDEFPPDTVLALSSARKPGRGNILAMDSRGRGIAVAKIARDDVGRHRLVHEAELGERLRGALPAPLSGPPLIRRGDGFLLFEAVDWVPRANAWELPVDVARAMGRFHLAGRSVRGGGGFTHGDFAPWNLLQTTTGWSLVDWADASDDGPAFFDPLHYLVQSHALLGRPRRDEILAGLRGKGPVGATLRAYADGAEVDLADAPLRMRDYLDVSESTHAPGADESRGRRARAGLRLHLTNPRD